MPPLDQATRDRITAEAKRRGIDPAKAIAAADHHRWAQQHHPDVVADRLAEVILRGDYTCADFLADCAQLKDVGINPLVGGGGGKDRHPVMDARKW